MQMEAIQETNYVTFKFGGVGVCGIAVGLNGRRMSNSIPSLVLNKFANA